MSEYPRDLLISESVIRDFEERVGVRFVNKTECAKALKEHDEEVRADAIDECIKAINDLNIEYAYTHTICNILEMLKE